jgi:hypothetical protein
MGRQGCPCHVRELFPIRSNSSKRETDAEKVKARSGSERMAGGKCGSTWSASLTENAAQIRVCAGPGRSHPHAKRPNGRAIDGHVLATSTPTVKTSWPIQALYPRVQVIYQSP